MSYDILPDSSSHHGSPVAPRLSSSDDGVYEDAIDENTDEWSFDGIGFIGEATFVWLNELIEFAQSDVLMPENSLPLPSKCGARYNRTLLERFWRRDKHSNKNSLVLSLWRCYGAQYSFLGIYLFLSTCALFVGPLLLKELVNKAESFDGMTKDVVFLIVILFASKLFASVTSTQYSYRTGMMAVKIGSAIKGCIFGKILLLSTESRRKYAAGSITNLYSTDIQRVTDMCIQLHRFWALPMQIFISMVMLYWVVGYAVVCGVVTIVIILTVNHYISTYLKKTTDRVQKCKDKRMECIGAWLNNPLVIKLNTWEEEHKRKITEARDKELVHIWTVLLIAAVNICLLWLAPCLVSVSTITSYAMTTDEISAANIFTALSLFKSLQDPFRDLPGIITQLFQAQSSIERLNRFMEQLEAEIHGTRLTIRDISAASVVPDADIEMMPLAADNDNAITDRKEKKKGEIAVLEARYSWSRPRGEDENEEDDEGDADDAEEEATKDGSERSLFKKAPDFVLSMPELTIVPRDLMVVMGQTGAGKSSFISAILGHMYLDSTDSEAKYDDGSESRLRLTGSTSYAGQQPFILNGSIKYNITLGKPMEHSRFAKVVQACCLDQDFALFSKGAETVIGEKGVGLSGGQRARVALARAVYADADIVILDDVFAALDRKVGERVFDQVVLKLLAGKTRIVVTHNHGILHHSAITKRVTLDHGKAVVESCRKDEGSDEAPRAEFIYSIDDVDVEKESATEAETTERDINKTDGSDVDASDSETQGPIKFRRNCSFADYRKGLQGSDVNEEAKELAEVEGAGMDKDTKEDRATGNISKDVYVGYITEMGGMRTIAFLCGIQIWWQILSVGSDVWLSRWTSESDQAQRHNLTTNIAVYGVLSIASGLTVFIRTYTISSGGFQACKSMFSRMTEALLYAPMNWLDNNPTGRILNRYSDDMSKIDLNLPFAVGSCFACLFSLAGTFVAVSIITRWLVFASIPIGYVYFKVMNKYLRASREIQRMQQVAQSPVLSFMAEVVNGGVPSIRAFRLEPLFLAWNDQKVNEYSNMQFLAQACSSWFTIRVQTIGAFILLAICLLAFSSVGAYIGASFIGLVLSYGLSISDELQFAVMILSWFENSMVCPERVSEYTMIRSELDVEHQLSLFRVPEYSLMSTPALNSSSPPGKWKVTRGDVEFKSVYFRYQPSSSSFVLRNVDFKVDAGTKVGIVGRTGSGKSSLAMALFRIAELSGGQIIIDDTDISTLDLHDLRANIEIIPQNPVILKGTLRTNMDPFQTYSDAEIIEAVRKCSLESVMVSNDSSASPSPSPSAAALAAIGKPGASSATSSAPERGGGALRRLIDYEIDEGGENLSVGQRQCIILARAVLRGAKVLICDEATANIDEKTESLIQNLIDVEFRSSTMIVIAHRLKTIMACDAILVMDQGQVVEFDSPQVLLQKKDSYFASLAAEHKDGD